MFSPPINYQKGRDRQSSAARVTKKSKLWRRFCVKHSFLSRSHIPYEWEADRSMRLRSKVQFLQVDTVLIVPAERDTTSPWWMVKYDSKFIGKCLLPPTYARPFRLTKERFESITEGRQSKSPWLSVWPFKRHSSIEIRPGRFAGRWMHH